MEEEDKGATRQILGKEDKGTTPQISEIEDKDTTSKIPTKEDNATIRQIPGKEDDATTRQAPEKEGKGVTRQILDNEDKGTTHQISEIEDKDTTRQIPEKEDNVTTRQIPEKEDNATIRQIPGKEDDATTRQVPEKEGKGATRQILDNEDKGTTHQIPKKEGKSATRQISEKEDKGTTLQISEIEDKDTTRQIPEKEDNVTTRQIPEKEDNATTRNIPEKEDKGTTRQRPEKEDKGAPRQTPENKDDKSTTRQIQEKAKSKWKSFKKTVWNSETNEFFGRTAASWAKILAFYFILFYPFLFAFWACMMLVLRETLNDNEPKYKLEESMIGTTPGLGYRPTPDTPPNSLKRGIIWFNPNDTDDVEYWASNLNSFLEPYVNNQSGSADDCSLDKPTNKHRICYVSVTNTGSCTSGSKFGYPEGKPCVLLKLNRIYDWFPLSYDEAPSELNSLLKSNFQKGLVYVTCVGESGTDKKNVGDISYYPKQGLPSYYYPFTNQKGYMSPLVFVKFGNLQQGVEVKVFCRAWAKNIVYDQKTKQGSVLIKLRLE